MTEELILTNALVVLADEVILGSVKVVDGTIADIGGPFAGGLDLEGDYLLPGLVELHTDHLENHYAPRPGVRWNAVGAVQAHDAQVAAAGITTVLDALRVGLNTDDGMSAEDICALAEGIRTSIAADRLRADHYLHLRCEVAAPDCLETFETFEADPLVKLASLMDHSPGQRQFASIEAYRSYYQRKKRLSDTEFERFAERRIAESREFAAPHRKAIAERALQRGITLASHDDATVEQVGEAEQHGIAIAEFPTTLVAAEASRRAGMSILMGAPNVVRGGSHSGNVGAGELARNGLLDILSSDYVPSSLLQSVFALEDEISLPEAVALVSRQPAKSAGFTDRGEIALGRRGDLVQVKLLDDVPLVRTVWREGRRVI